MSRGNNTIMASTMSGMMVGGSGGEVEQSKKENVLLAEETNNDDVPSSLRAHNNLSKKENEIPEEEANEDAVPSSLHTQQEQRRGGVSDWVRISTGSSGVSTTNRSGEEEQPPPNPAAVLLHTIGPAYASPACPTAIFWVETIGIILLGALTALVSLAYNNMFYVVSDKWMTNDPEKLAVFFGGEPYWIAIGAGTGIVVGILKAYVFKFDTYKGFIEVVQDLDVDVKESISMAIVGLVSLMGGASLGPESGLAGVGGLLGKLAVKPMNALCRRVLRTADGEDVSNDETKRRKLLILSTLVSAFATMLPTPATSVVFCVELMGMATFLLQGLTYTKSVVQLGLAGTAANLVYTSLVNKTYIQVDEEFPGYLHQTDKWKNAGVSVAFGACTPFCLAIPYFVFAGIAKISRVKLQAFFVTKFGDQVRIVLMATLGGAIYGLLGYIFPLTPGDGAYQMQAVMKYGAQMESSVLVVSSYAKMLTYWVSAEYGFVGGIFHPILMISLLFGRMIINETTVNETLGTALSFILLAAAFTPLPFSMYLLDLGLFNLKSSDQVSIFLAIIIAHLMTTGVGFPQKFLSAAVAIRKRRENEAKSSEEIEPEQQDTDV